MTWFSQNWVGISIQLYDGFPPSVLFSASALIRHKRSLMKYPAKPSQAESGESGRQKERLLSQNRSQEIPSGHFCEVC